jgi:hypothetical protein
MDRKGDGVSHDVELLREGGLTDQDWAAQKLGLVAISQPVKGVVACLGLVELCRG